VILEGMAAGVPVVATKGGGPSEIVTDGVDGLLYPPGDVDELARLLRKLDGDAELRRRLAAAGRERVREFTPSIVSAKLLRVYESVLSRAGRPHPSVAGNRRR
jgi:glycosyltransferase involved in cell wall biosynthesis